MPKLLFGIISLTSLCFQASSQEARAPEFGLGSGVAIYQGDLSPSRYGSFRKADLSFNLFSQFEIHRFFSLRGGYAFAALQENDRSYTSGYKPYRNFSFETLVNELSLQVVFSPFMHLNNENRKAVIPYLVGGVGYAFLRINRYWNDFDHSWPHWQSWVREGLATDSAHALPNKTITFPLGLGIRYRIGENFSLFAEANHRFTREEYLDGFSKACNPEKQDAFTTITAGAIFQRAFYPGRRAKRTSY